MSFALCLFVSWTILGEFYKGSVAIRAKTGQNLLAAAVELTHRNTRRYGGYLVHIGIVHHVHRLHRQSLRQRHNGRSRCWREVPSRRLRDARSANSWTATTRITPGVTPRSTSSRTASSFKTLEPERRGYKASRQPTSEVDIWRRLNEDVYVNFAGSGVGSNKAVIQAYIFPLVSWIWIGFWVLLIGTIVCLIPSKSETPVRKNPSRRSRIQRVC